MERIFITGGRGLLGREIAAAFRSAGEVRITDREECDIVDLDACRREISAFGPDVVIHCAAYTAVDLAEKEAAAAREANATGTRNVARVCKELGALLTTFGTDYVFDGRIGRPYVEGDAPNPLSEYGRSKLEAEEALREEGVSHLLVRTQWLYGAGGKNFIRTILAKAGGGETLRVASDQTGCPTYAKDLAEAVLRLLSADARGTVHFSNEGETTWYGLARYVLDLSPFCAAVLVPARSRDLPYPAQRPAYAPLCKEKYRRITGVSPRHWRDAVREYLEAERNGGVPR